MKDHFDHENSVILSGDPSDIAVFEAYNDMRWLIKGEQNQLRKKLLQQCRCCHGDGTVDDIYFVQPEDHPAICDLCEGIGYVCGFCQLSYKYCGCGK